MLASKTTLKEINEKNCHFWEEQRVLLAEWMANDVLRTTAFELMNDESRRDVPLRSRQSIHAAFAVLAVIRRRILTDQARQAGKARKSDALQRLIEQMVQRYFADAPGVVQEVFGGEGSQHLRLPVLNGPIEVRDTKAVDEEINDFKAALGNTSPDTALSRPSRLS